MRILADECCDASLVRALRAAGHDLKAIVETHRGATDQQVLQKDRTQFRPLLTRT